MSSFQVLLTMLALLVSINISYAQDDKIVDVKEIFDNNQELEALALYPDDIREGILELCLYPELIVKLGAIQANTQSSFQEIIQYQSEEVQKNFYELLRYPGLIDDLVLGGQKNRKQIEAILESYPDDIHSIALDYGSKRFVTLDKINAIDRQANETLSLLLSGYNSSTAEKVKHLLKFPEVLHIMVEHIDVAILVGEQYEKDPKAVIAKAEEMKLEVARKHQKDIEDWKKGLEDDPKALQEFEEASNAFKEEADGYVDYDPMYPNSSVPENDSKAISQESDDVYIEDNYYPYPYWYGYPAWFPHVYWYRYPYWYHWGFYYGPQRSMVMLGLPSYYYFYWYFEYPTHYYRYPYLSDYIIRYYRTRRGVGPSRSSLTRSVDEWSRSSRSRIPHSILDERNDQIRRQKLREYGRFEEEYRKRLKKRPGETGTREEYLRKNSRRYQYLSGETRTIKKRSTKTTTGRSQPNIRTTQKPRSTDLNRARETHQRTWQKSNYSRSRSKVPVSRSGSNSTTKKRRKKN